MLPLLRRAVVLFSSSETGWRRVPLAKTRSAASRRPTSSACLGVDWRVPVVDLRVPVVDSRVPVVDWRVLVVDWRVPVVDWGVPVVVRNAPVCDHREATEAADAAPTG